MKTTVLVFSFLISFSQDFSNKGKEFWIAYSAHIDGTTSVMGIYLTATSNTTATVVVGPTTTLNVNITANQVTRVFLGNGAGNNATNAGVYLNMTDGIKVNAAIKITSPSPIVVYSHICRGLYYGSYMEPREWLWVSGVILFFLMMGTAFTGYVLPWGQMSFWGATVITSMVTVIPVVGSAIVEWLWGGYTIKNPTLNRFFVIHFLLPFFIAGFTLIHLALLHKVGSNSPIGSDTGVDDVPFYPYYASKDLFALSCFLVFFATFVFYFPNVLNHPDNCIPADPFETPRHVVPEWYFLAYYAILRGIPHKTGGIIAMFGSIAVLFIIPFINSSEIRNTTYRPIFKFFFWLFLADFVILVIAGQKPVTDTYKLVSQVATVYYFMFFLVIIPVVGKIEAALVRHKS